MMIQNENLLYNDQRIYFLHNHTRARACARQKSVKLDIFTKKSLFYHFQVNYILSLEWLLDTYDS